MACWKPSPRRALAFSLYAQQNQGRCPITFDQAVSFLPDEAKGETNLTPDQFEIVYQGSLMDLTNRANIIVIPLLPRRAAARVSEYLHQYSAEKGIYMKINYVNADHVHVLVDLPTSLSIEEMTHLLKGASSHWINQSNLLTCMSPLLEFGFGDI